MDSRKGGPPYRCADTALVRAARYSRLPLPAWPDLTDDTPARQVRWQAWLRDVWSMTEVADTIEQASPLLAQQINTLCSAAHPHGSPHQPPPHDPQREPCLSTQVESAMSGVA
ncbi:MULTISPECIES: hypothetical protein [Streptomyces]|uniref:Uncharacterized protein n=1 Tax=Streptomyces galilaeus TaxID=33899 RepID=A0ABW9IW34_STRGJ